ncbi:PAS domain S-box-containing protein [Caulobacter ginsengisoli]|uniref:histidine kinase n=1 Tax=Caulobacter ginsengisoli TaxID=400775 RepID=A0ABU0IX53_9CAUL|nr:HWE histidine kinase domain-containing protein [Caulobacter ginsengisoli]MDQ0466582.1 PAS domain S-box-containing protein [Caulobacter ginsengisoli]
MSDSVLSCAPPSPGTRSDAEALRLMEGIFALAMDGIITVDADQRIVLFNPAAEAIFQIAADQVVGQPFWRFIPERYRAVHADHVARFLGSATANQAMGPAGTVLGTRTISGLRADGEEFPIEASISQVEVGGARFATVILRDITERIANEEARELLAREVDHRAKNALAVVQALVSLTRASTQEEFVNAVRGRVSALGRAHSLLALNRWKGGDLASILADETEPYQRQGQVHIRGPAVVLGPDSVQPVSLLVHELATNAAKYGALSVETGRVDIETAIRPDESLELRWTETGGPPVEPPAVTGFGSTLMTRLVTRQLGGSVEVDWLSRGLRLTAVLPRSAYRPGSAPNRLADAASPEPAATPAQNGRVLVVEDDALVAMDLCEQLAALGWEIIGPATTLEEAAQLLAASPTPDIAVLDVNLRGRLVYPLADQLRSRGVPLIFCTGYEQIDARYGDCPVVRKPVSARLLDAELRTLRTPAG